LNYIIEFKGNRRALYRAPDDLQVQIGKYAIVQAERGEDMGKLLRQATEAESAAIDSPYSIIRLATENDLDRLNFNRQKEFESKDECLRFIEKHKLKMKLVDVEYQFDCNKITFYFTAEKRVDFRELVKDLAATFRTRIELRQIGVRDEAKRIGGYGICGKEQCCSAFLDEFQTISTQMARTQNLALNPQKISGNCGRLLCCLQYEQEFYEQTISQYPPAASRCKFHGAECRVHKCNIFHEEITLNFDDATQKTINLSEYKRATKRGKFKVLEKRSAPPADNNNNSKNNSGNNK
jgi:cell fate regulator YaaT (PSP1 superfamily)